VGGTRNYEHLVQSDSPSAAAAFFASRSAAFFSAAIVLIAKKNVSDKIASTTLFSTLKLTFSSGS
jgi:hypothetical protein